LSAKALGVPGYSQSRLPALEITGNMDGQSRVPALEIYWNMDGHSRLPALTSPGQIRL